MVKISIYLTRRVFVMTYISGAKGDMGVEGRLVWSRVGQGEGFKSTLFQNMYDLIVNHIAWYQNEVFTKSFVLGGWNRAMTQ